MYKPYCMGPSSAWAANPFAVAASCRRERQFKAAVEAASLSWQRKRPSAWLRISEARCSWVQALHNSRIWPAISSRSISGASVFWILFHAIGSLRSVTDAGTKATDVPLRPQPSVAWLKSRVLLGNKRVFWRAVKDGAKAIVGPAALSYNVIACSPACFDK